MAGDFEDSGWCTLLSVLQQIDLSLHRKACVVYEQALQYLVYIHNLY